MRLSLAVVALVGACSSGDSEPALSDTPTGSTPPEVTRVETSTAAVETTTTVKGTHSNTVPFHPVADDAVVVWGTVLCREIPSEDDFVLECALDMSDPRVNGTERIEQFQTVASGQWIFHSQVMTNA